MEPQRAEAPSIFRIATKYGVIQGVLGFVAFLGVTLSGIRPNWSSGIGIVLLIVLMVLAHRAYKSTHEGMMTYPQGLGLGTLLAVIASVTTGILLFIYIKYINTGYPAAMMKIQQAAIEQRGLTGAQADQAMAMTAMMLTPVGIFITSVLSGAFAGFVVALIVSIFTRKGDPRAVY